MDAKDLRTETALSERNNDGSKYSQSGSTALQCDRNKSYQDIGSNSLVKVDVQNVRPCAVIGPDRIVPPPANSETYLKKTQNELWPCIDNAYHTRLPPEYPHKLANFQNPTRNISPRQTYQENMQRIMVPPTYNSMALNDDAKYTQMLDRNNPLHKNIKINVPPEAKFCDVPYSSYSKNSNDQKSVRISDVCLNTLKPAVTCTAPHGWPPGSVNIHSTRTYGAPELYQYQEYSNCVGPRPVLPRSNRSVPEESAYIYAEPYYHQEGNIRFKPYPHVKERPSHQRYDYIGNYANTFHPSPAFHSHKYELQKAIPPHPYPQYPPIKYLDRAPDMIMESYQRNHQGGYNIPYHNQPIHPNFTPVIGNNSHNKMHSYPSDGHIKTVLPNKHDYENSCPKLYSSPDNYLVNEMGKLQTVKSQVIMPNYSNLNIHNIPLNPYYKKENHHLKNFEYIPPHIKNMDPNLNVHNSIIRHGPVYPPTTLAISPTDSIGSADASHIIGTSPEDCGYVSQSSTASIRSIDSGINRLPNEYMRKYYDSRFGPFIRPPPMMSKSELNPNSNSKERKNLNVRQFLQMWNEGDDETDETNTKEVVIQSSFKNDKFNKTCEVTNQPNQEQLYVLGLVNVPSDEIGKYEHIQKVSKLPENIKGYNHIELLNQFEEAIESSNMSTYKATPKDYQIPFKGVPMKQTVSSIPPRPLSPLDVEAKISQSIIHKEVGCNFEIKPCSPKMLNVEVATPVQNILAERVIEKVANPVMLKSPRLNLIEDNNNCKMNRKDNRLNINDEAVIIPSCKMVNTHYSNHTSLDAIKNSYSLHDLESNSGLCLASLPRLDNDIELNFPEVNQQFINANKGDSTSLGTPVRDLPTLEDLEQSNNAIQNKHSDMHVLSPNHNIIKSPCVVDSEKEGREISKLSKYRKNKTNLSDLNENLNATRKDSVIIKNPENSKNYEENILSPNCLKQNRDIESTPMNLTSQGNDDVDNNTPSSKPYDNKETETPLDIAIDFSLSKTDSNDNFECKAIESLTQNIIETNDSILDDHLTKIPLFSYCDPNDVSKPIRNIEKIRENSNMVENTSNEEINTPNTSHNEPNIVNEQLSSMPYKNLDIKNQSDENSCMLSESYLCERKNITASKLLPIEFITHAECLQTAYDNDNIDDNQKLDAMHELKDIMDIDNTQNQVSKMLNKTCVVASNAKEEIGSDIDIHKQNDIDISHNNQTITIENSEVIEYSDLKLINNTKESQEAKNIKDSQSRNCSELSLTTELQRQLENPQNINLKSTDALKLKNEKSGDIKDPKHINYPDLKFPNSSNQIGETSTLDNPQNIKISNSKLACDLNYTDQTTGLQDTINTSPSDINLTSTEISNNNINVPKTIAVPSSDEIVKSSLDNYIETKPHFNILSRSNNSMLSNNLENSIQIADIKIGLTSEITTVSGPGYSEADNIISSSNDTITADVKLSSQNKTVKQDLDFTKTTTIQNDCNVDIPCPIDSEMCNQNNNIYLKEADSNRDSPILNINETGASHDYQPSQMTNLDNNDNVNAVSNTVNNITIHQCKDYECSGSLLEEEKYQCVEMSHTETKDLKDNVDKVNDKKLDTYGIQSLGKERRFLGYLTYGSKAMYSPQIQSLILLCEGVFNKKKVVQNDDSNYSDIIITKTLEDIEMSNDCKNYLQNNKTDCINESVSTIEKEVLEAMEISNTSDIDISKKNADEHEIHSAGDKLSNINTLFNDELHSPKAAVFNAEETENGIITFPSDSNIEKTICKDTHFDKLNIPEILENDKASMSNFTTLENELSRDSSCLEATNNCDEQQNTVDKVHKTEIGSAVQNEETHDLEIACKSIEEDIISNDSLISLSIGFAKTTETLDTKIETNNDVNTQDEQFNINEPMSRETKSINNEINEVIDKQLQSNNENTENSEIKDSTCSVDFNPEQDGKLSNFNNNISDYKNNLSNCDDEIVEELITHHTYTDESSSGFDKNSICIDEVLGNVDNKSISYEEPDDEKQLNQQLNNSKGILMCGNEQSNFNLSHHEQSSAQFSRNDNMSKQIENLNQNGSDKERTSLDPEIDAMNCTEMSTRYNLVNRKRQRLKRSLSDSALNIFNNEHTPQDNEENISFLWPFKRKKTDNVDNQFLAQNLCSIIQSNRRNSVSTFYNEDVSFCIVIDDSCIIAEENDHEKICYTELSEMQNDCDSHIDNIETMTEVITSQQESDCDYSDSYLMQGIDNKLTESWVEDVGCVETVIDDDIAENVEISGPLSPKDDDSSDNNESGVFSSSEYTDKVKFIYGEKISNDDAHFVQMLYNTPQKDVNKTLVRRESIISAEYYDNDSLEKILSESSDKRLSPCLPDCTQPLISSGVEEVQETKGIGIESITSWQKRELSLDVADVAIQQIDVTNRILERSFNDQNDVVHSCESSVDGIFMDNEHTENTNYVTSSSPEVSSTTSEDKNASILLKITNYKGSRVSRVNDIRRDRMRPSCKFTEDKDYVQSHVNFPKHRPLLTKGAQKYIPPLKESIGDLKVKLTLPPHSLMKLKQLKNSKDQPKVYKQNNFVPRASKKPKPKFEDVLKSIDEIQFKMHKEKAKKSKKSVPKVVIKKNENGSHYASTSCRADFNPDLTGRKWQPWVFIEKNHFIDKMAMKKKIKAVYSHRKRTYVLAEKFQKYKSVNDSKFVITPPVSDCLSTGLKYTIRLKHTY